MMAASVIVAIVIALVGALLAFGAFCVALAAWNDVQAMKRERPDDHGAASEGRVSAHQFMRLSRPAWVVSEPRRVQ